MTDEDVMISTIRVLKRIQDDIESQKIEAVPLSVREAWLARLVHLAADIQLGLSLYEIEKDSKSSQP